MKLSKKGLQNLKNFGKKKGTITFNMLMYGITRLALLIIVVAVITTLVRTYINVSINTFDAETELIYNRFLYSVNGISYYDTSINRLYPGIIDVKRLNSSILDKSIDFGEYPRVGAEIILRDIRKGRVKSAFYNEDFYIKKKVLADLKTKGIGGARSVKKQSFVLYKDEHGNTKQGYLEVEIVIPNT